MNRVVELSLRRKVLACGCSIEAGQGWKRCAAGRRIWERFRDSHSREARAAWVAHFHPETLTGPRSRSAREIVDEMRQEGKLPASLAGEEL